MPFRKRKILLLAIMRTSFYPGPVHSKCIECPVAKMMCCPKPGILWISQHHHPPDECPREDRPVVVVGQVALSALARPPPRRRRYNITHVGRFCAAKRALCWSAAPHLSAGRHNNAPERHAMLTRTNANASERAIALETAIDTFYRHFEPPIRPLILRTRRQRT